jgi:methionyl-tRNA synthetase
MINRYVDGLIPKPPAEDEVAPPDAALMETYHSSFARMSQAIDDFALREALEAIWVFVRKTNAYVEEVAPWALAKQDDERRRLEVVLYVLADALRLTALTLFPIVPKAAQEIWKRLGLEGSIGDHTFSEDGGWGLVPTRAAVEVGAPLFPRLEEENPDSALGGAIENPDSARGRTTESG